MPFNIKMNKEFSRLTNFLGVMVFPICLSFAMPIFLYNLVLEKELKLLENMKINGLQIQTYWKVQGCYNLALFLSTVILFMFSGRYVFHISFFEETSFMALFELFFVWGLC